MHSIVEKVKEESVVLPDVVNESSINEYLIFNVEMLIKPSRKAEAPCSSRHMGIRINATKVKFSGP